MSDPFEIEQERHRRRMMLMRMQGSINRQEGRLHILWCVAAILGGLALLLMAAIS